jgi:hypothetical protein
VPEPLKINWWYERLVDWMLLNPEKLLGDAARHFNVTQAWLSVVKNSDAFKAYYDARSAAFSSKIEDAGISTLIGVKEKVASAAELALDEIHNRLATTGKVMTLNELMSIAKLDLAAKGYAATAKSAPPGVAVYINNGGVNRAVLEAAREKMKLLGGVSSSPLPVAIDAGDTSSHGPNLTIDYEPTDVSEVA